MKPLLKFIFKCITYGLIILIKIVVCTILLNMYIPFLIISLLLWDKKYVTTIYKMIDDFEITRKELE